MAEKRVLVVDDESFIRELVKDFLELENIECDEAVNSIEALNQVKNNEYGLVLLDKHLDNVKTQTVVQKLREEKPDVPVLLLTGDHNCSNEYLSETGVNGAIYKPFQVEEFLKTVLKFIEE